MISKKSDSPIFILFVLTLLLLLSCKKEVQNPDNTLRKKEYAAFVALAEQGLEKNKYDSAFYYYNKAKSTCDLSKDNEKIIYLLLQMAAIQQVFGDYSGIESSVTEALNYVNKETNPVYENAIYNFLGIAFRRQFDYDRAIRNYKRALNNTEDQYIKALVKNNIAVVYMDQHKYQEAIKILSPLLQQKEVLDHPETLSRMQDNIGYSYFKIDDPKGLDLLNRSLELRNENKDDYGVIASYNHLAIFHQKSNPDLALHYALLNYQKTTELKTTDDRLEALQLVIQNSSGKESKKFSLIHIRLNDSINKLKQVAKNEFAKIRYDSTKIKTENGVLKSDKERISFRNTILIIVILAFLLIAVLLYFLLKIKHRKDKLGEAYATEIRISKQLHDELANDVFNTLTFAETQNLSSAKNKEILLHSLDTIYARTRNISKENNTIDTGREFVNRLKEMMASYSNPEINVIINGFDSFNWTLLEEHKKIALYRILQELLVNMKKHSQCSLVAISFKRMDNQIQVVYTDNGIGFSSDKIIIKNGLQNVENRIEAIKGTITFGTVSGKGFKVSLTFPF
jgi:signal transduction histidine kinase/predicted negative regulator of RcsB-dependent stress response